MFPPCHVLICQCRPASRPVRQTCTQRDLDEARSYYEGKKRISGWKPMCSLESWCHVALVDTIRYRRDHAPPFQHPFDHPVRLYVSTTGPLTDKLTLPKGCIINDHGFVEP